MTSAFSITFGCADLIILFPIYLGFR